MIQKSITHKARLLHYFAMSEQDVQKDQSMDSWCGLHIDHSVLTGLTSAMYCDESDANFPEIDKTIHDVQDALRTAGLYIKNRDGSYTQVSCPLRQS